MSEVLILRWLLGALLGGLSVVFAIGKWTNRQETITETPIYRILKLEEAAAKLEDYQITKYKIQEIEGRMEQASEQLSKLTGKMTELKASWDSMEKRRTS